MAFIFPEDKADFTAPNGVTYSWDGDKWVTKTYSGAEGDERLPYRLGTDKAARSARVGDPAIELVDAQDNYSNVKFFGVNGIECESTIQGIKIDGHQLIGSGDIDLTKYATLDYSDTEDHKLQLQIDELGVTKGKVARYTPTSITGGFVSRPGEVAFNSGVPSAVNQISFGTEDSDNVLTKPMADGDIIEFVDAIAGNVSRYKISDASSAPTAVAVEYISGDNTFVVGQEEQVYIYPQNESGVTKDYVDAQDALRLPLSGGELTGTLNGLLVKSHRSTGYAFEVKPDNLETVAYLACDGRILGKRLTIDGTNERAQRAFQVKGERASGGDPSFDFFYMYTNASGTPDAVNYSGKMDSDFNITNVKYVRDAVADAVADVDGGGVELWGGSNPPPSSDRGTLLLTSTNQLYIYTT